MSEIDDNALEHFGHIGRAVDETRDGSNRCDRLTNRVGRIDQRLHLTEI